MEAILKLIKQLQNSEIGDIVESRIREFKEIGKQSNDVLFSELCFCIMTANFNAERSIMIQKNIGDGFSKLSKVDLSKKFRILGHRFPNARSNYVVEARNVKDKLKTTLCSYSGYELRDWFVKNVKGISNKEASHFLRNIGFDDYAIIDFHIIDILVDHNLIKKPKTINRKTYLEIEKILQDIADNSGLTMSELDLYLWYLETGKILK